MRNNKLSQYIAVIQAGGKGTRLQELTKDQIPKPLLKLNGKPIIEWQIENIKKYGITEFIIIVGHLGNKIKEYFEDGAKWNIHISYIEETSPLGSAGALYYLKEKTNFENILLVFGDVVFDMNLDRFIEFHEKNHSLATLTVHPNNHPYDSDLLLVDQLNRIYGYGDKSQERKTWYHNLVNAGIYLLSKSLLTNLISPNKCDLEKDLIFPLINSNQIYAYRTSEYIKDVGTVTRFYNACEEQDKGIWKRKNLENKQKCIFLDRDGTINRYKGLISNESQFELEESVGEALKLINASEYLAIVVTNQPVVARGLCTVEELDIIHKKMEVLLGDKGTYLDDIIYCPHHPDKGYPEENPLYKITCTCRKPQTGMIEKMVEKYNIDLGNSYIIGDSTVDIQTGVNVGLKTVLVKTGVAGIDKKYNVQADIEADNLLEAVKRILV